MPRFTTTLLLDALSFRGLGSRPLGVAAAASVTLAVSAATISGTDENDRINGSYDPPTTEEADTVHAGAGNDIVYGLGGDDTLHGEGGDDWLSGGPGDDTASGGDGIDTLEGDEGHDTLDGGPGDDTLSGDPYGFEGNDTLIGGPGEDSLTGNWGDDTLDGGDDDDDLYGGYGDDTLDAGGGNDEAHGGHGDDVLHGHHGNDSLFGDHGHDHLWGDTGDDYLVGGGGADYLDGGDGADVLDGGGDGDVVLGRNPGETLIGGSDDDYIVLVGQTDPAAFTIYDGYTRHADGSATQRQHGTDMLCFVDEVNEDQVTYIEMAPHNQLHTEFDVGLGTAADITIDLAEHEQLVFIEAIRTGTGDDTVFGRDTPGMTTSSYARQFGHAGINWIHAQEVFVTGDGNDTIHTRGGHDFIDSGNGDDTIHLGPGEHSVFTGAGRDTMILQADELDGVPHTVWHNATCRFLDFAPGDTLHLQGDVSPDDISVEVGTVPGMGYFNPDPYEGLPMIEVMVNGREEFNFFGLPGEDLVIDAHPQGGVRFTVRGRDGSTGPHLDPSAPAPDRTRDGDREPGRDREDDGRGSNDRVRR